MNVETAIAQVVIDSAGFQFYKQDATEEDLEKPWVVPIPFGYSTKNETAPCAGVTYYDMRKIISNVPGRKAVTHAFINEIGKVVDWKKIEFISSGETAGMPFAAWVADEMKKPMVSVIKETQPCAGGNSDLCFEVGDRERLIADIVNEIPSGVYNWVGTGRTVMIPFAAWVADRLDLPMFYVREEEKTHGAKNSIVGPARLDLLKDAIILDVDQYLDGTTSVRMNKYMEDAGAHLGPKSRVWGLEDPSELNGMYGIHIDDLQTSGGNSINFIKSMQGIGAKIEYCWVVTDRMQGGAKNIERETGTISKSLTTQYNILDIVKERYFEPVDLKNIESYNKNARDWMTNWLQTDPLASTLVKESPDIILKGYPQLTEKFKDILGGA